ncbi:MAG: DUF1631 family protein [Pseudomonadota bacterium]
MNKRTAPRFPITLDVNVTFPSTKVDTCTVRDYCAGGMYLICNREGKPVESVRLGDSVTIEFDDPLRNSSHRFHIEAHVVHFEDHGMGVAFTRNDTEMVVALSQLALSQSAGGSGVAGSAVAAETYGRKAVAQLISYIEAGSRRQINTILDEFFRKAPEALFDAASGAENNAGQSAYIGAVNELRKNSELLRTAFHERFNEQFELLSTPGFRNRYRQEATARGELSLLESNELDTWLTVRAVSSQLEERLGETLEALETRFEEISANPVNLENNPIGPFVIVSIFLDTLNRLALEEASVKLLLSVMKASLGEKLKALYDELNETMIAHGILPTVHKTMEVVKKPDGDDIFVTTPPPAPRRRQAGGHATGEGGMDFTGQPAPTLTALRPRNDHATGAQAEERKTKLAYASKKTGQSPHSASPSSAANSSPASSKTTIFRENEQTTQRDDSGGPSPRVSNSSSPSNTTNPAHAIHELVQLQSSLGAEKAGVHPPPEAYFTSEQLITALDRIDRPALKGIAERDRISSIEQALSAALGEEGLALDEGDKDSITYVGGLLSSINEDVLVAEQARQWFRQLEVPLLVAGLLDDTLQMDESHPARELLNRLEAVGDLLQGDDSVSTREARQRIESILQRVGEKVKSDPGVFAEALNDLTEVQDFVEESYEENVTKLIERCEREKNLDQARRKILNELNRRLGKQKVPLVVLNLLDSGWKNLLLRTLLKEGADSASFNGYLNVIDRLAARLTGQATHRVDAVMPDDELLEWVAQMLNKVSSNEQRNEQLYDEIVEGLAANSTSQIEARYVPALISRSVTHQNRTDTHKPEEVSDDVWSLMLEDARELNYREVFLFNEKGSAGVQVNFIWQDGARRFVFADNRGHKVLDLELGEVASALYNKILIRINEKALSVTERATYNFLQTLHNRITYQANHDGLTGLPNRRFFMLELEKAMDDAKSCKATHVLAYFDLDRFNLVNNTCGHAEGDVLLGKIATVLRENIGDDGLIARLGGDEFGIILRNVNLSDGLKQLTAIHDSVRNIRFACENNEFKVTCSMGVAEISERSDSAGHLLSAVDSAAFAAKDSGRDNIQVYNTDNQRISSREDVLSWVGRINVLFEKNLIKLRCQKIAPLHKATDSLPHYEVLLDVQDENGNKVPVEEFIVAAERYNRILDIDTWVVNYIFGWLEKYASKLNLISNLSVNLSGVSLGNRRFIDRLYERLSSTGFPAGKLCFEVTETVAMRDLEASARFMRKLKETGCLFSLDDFGSGSSSYAYLRSLPIDYIKVDAAFVKDIATNTDDYAVVKSINEIGHVMGKQTVAEGVENDFAYQLLHDIGVDFVQGFGVEKPIPLYQLFR